MTRNLCILMPVYNDWESIGKLLDALDAVAAENDLLLQIMLVDDGSTLPPPVWNPSGLSHITSLETISLIRNLGHQRAIAVGLSFLNKLEINTPVIVMDGDGEDKPEDILRLLVEHNQHPNQIIFARRAKRSEGGLFRIFYVFFKAVFWFLTGNMIAFGNFCIIPAGLVPSVTHLQELWNHFAAGIMHSNIQWKTIPTTRGKRYAGESHMNLVSLVLHGLSAISVYTEIVYVRLIFLSFVIIFLDVIGFLILLYIKYFTQLAIPGWGTSVAIGLVLVMLQIILFLTVVSFAILGYRSMKMFIPAIDFQDYVYKTNKLI